MTEPAVPSDPGEPNRFENPQSDLPAAGPDVDLAPVASLRRACRSLAVFGPCAGWGLAVVGILGATDQLLEMPGVGTADRAAWTLAGVRTVSRLLAFGLAGWGVAATSRLAAASILEYLDRVARVSDQTSRQASHGLAILERIADAMETRGASTISNPPSGLERARSMAEIVRATRASEWVEAETRLREFEIEFPEDPELSYVKENLASARDGVIKAGLAQLEAARAVNDPSLVLDIYRDLGPSLEGQQRASLDQEIARWLLSLIHRRLRTGKVQTDVVQLAARFAENFAATVEGASVRASLPTLRRSVGLCPRCARPYTGVAEACPQCLKGVIHAPSVLPSNEESNLPE